MKKMLQVTISIETLLNTLAVDKEGRLLLTEEEWLRDDTDKSSAMVIKKNESTDDGPEAMDVSARAGKMVIKKRSRLMNDGPEAMEVSRAHARERW